MPVLLSLAAPTVETNLYIGPNKSRALTSALHSGERHDASMMDGRTKCITGPGIAYSGFHLKVSMSAFHLFAVKVLGYYHKWNPQLNHCL